MERFGKYEYEVRDISQRGDLEAKWEYRVKNLETGIEFKYVIKITKSALSCDPKTLWFPISKVVETRGKYVAEEWLKEGVEFDLTILVSERNWSFM